MDAMQIRPLTEEDLHFVIQSAGGEWLHPDPTVRTEIGADFRLGGTVIELKSLDEEGFDKPERQKKLARIFRSHFPHRPVIVLDRRALPAADQRAFDGAVVGPIKAAVAKAAKQLKQSRRENPGTTCSVLWMVNNGFTTLDHEQLVSLCVTRARNDTREIDAVVVSACYYHSDGFDGYFLWPLDVIPLNVGAPFREAERLREGWSGLATAVMTEIMQAENIPRMTKGPVQDTQFDVDGVTYVRPAPAIGGRSEFWARGRPRRNSTCIETCPRIATTFPLITRPEWQTLRRDLPDDLDIGETFEEWRRVEATALEEEDPLKPLVRVRTPLADWRAWCTGEGREPTGRVLFDFANHLFNAKARCLISGAREWTGRGMLPARCVVAVTEVIGQDMANDVSHVVRLTVGADGDATETVLLSNVRIFHEHAVALGAAFAVRDGVATLLWSKNLRYAWI